MNFTSYFQGFTYPVTELFLEDVLEKTRYSIRSEFENFEGNSRRRRRQKDTKKDPLTELFEAISYSFSYLDISQIHIDGLYFCHEGMPYIMCVKSQEIACFLGKWDWLRCWITNVIMPHLLSVNLATDGLYCDAKLIGYILMPRGLVPLISHLTPTPPKGEEKREKNKTQNI